MKILFIRLVTLPNGAKLLTGVCLLVTIATQIPQALESQSISAERNQFPEEDERRGAGTRWFSPFTPQV